MEGSYLLVLGFCTWTFLLLLGIGVERVGLTMIGRKRANSFGPSGEKGSTFSHRIGRAHANCCENLPLVIGVILVAFMTNQLAVTNGLAWVFLTLRIAQSIIHIISVSVPAVLIRFSLFLGQCAIMIFWLFKLWFH